MNPTTQQVTLQAARKFILANSSDGNLILNRRTDPRWKQLQAAWARVQSQIDWDANLGKAYMSEPRRRGNFEIVKPPVLSDDRVVEPITGLCTTCGGSHWRQDCKKDITHNEETKEGSVYRPAASTISATVAMEAQPRLLSMLDGGEAARD